jgi:protein gp37
MGDSTAIAWTDHTFNPWLGCHKVSAGCQHCYAERLVTRMSKQWNGPKLWGLHGPRRRTSETIWRKPPKWNNEAVLERRPHRVFCASLADVFEDEPGPNSWRADVFKLIRECRWLDWQLLTKRPENIARMVPDDWSIGNYPNVWLGTSIEDNRVVDRAFDLTATPATVHFVSYEPAIGPVDELSLVDIEWLIVGGESGPGYRPMDLDWVRDVRYRCGQEGTAFFFKQDAAPRTEMGIDALGEVVRNYPNTWDRGGGNAI